MTEPIVSYLSQDTGIPERPGEALRRAREAADMSRQRVCRELRLPLELITAIEEDDYEALPEAAFLRGYIRAYAKLLNHDSEALLAAYEDILPRTGGWTGPSRAAGRDPEDVRERYVWVAIALAIVIVLIIGGWVWTRSLGTEEQQTSVDDLLAELAPEAVTEDAAENAATGTAAAEPASDVPSRSTPPPAAGAAANTAQSPSAAAGVDNKPAPRRASPSESGEAKAEAEAEAVEATNPAEPAPAVDASPSMRMRFTQQSWVEVSDASGERLLYGLMDAGEQRSLQGEPPFKVFLGNAPGVEIRYRGETFEHQRYHKSNATAEFSVR